MASDHDNSTADESRSSRKVIFKTNDEASHELFFLNDATSSNVTSSANANSGVNDDTSSSGLSHNTTKKGSEKSMGVSGDERQTPLMIKGTSETRKDVPSPKESYDKLPSSCISTDDR